ncbi:MAG: hypothetical protein AAFO94_00455 [Bacteroidota bacterium]
MDSLLLPMDIGQRMSLIKSPEQLEITPFDSKSQKGQLPNHWLNGLLELIQIGFIYNIPGKDCTKKTLKRAFANAFLLRIKIGKKRHLNHTLLRRLKKRVETQLIAA